MSAAWISRPGSSSMSSSPSMHCLREERMWRARPSNSVPRWRGPMKAVFPFVVVACLAFLVGPAQAQHCASIYESYLSQISLKHDPSGRALDLKLDYTKRGGALNEKYQIYLLAYLEKN